MNVQLTLELDQFIAAKVSSGLYTSPNEVVGEALRLLEERDQARSAQLSSFNAELEHRLQSLDKGEHVTPEAARSRLLQKSQDRKQRSA